MFCKVNVTISSNHWHQLLQGMYSKLHQKQLPTKTFDPLVMLPSELAQMVCEYLEMRDLV
jgi:hypothetical protein